MARSRKYRMTPRRRTALKKAQLASARKRSRNKKIAVVAGVSAVVIAGVAAHKLSGSSLSISKKQNISVVTGKRLPNGANVTRLGNELHANIRRGGSRLHVSYRFGKAVVTGHRVNRSKHTEIGDPLSHVSNEGKKYRQEISSKTGKASGGSAESRIVPSTRSLWEKQTYYSDLRHRRGR